MSSDAQYDIVMAQIEDATAKGAHLECGGPVRVGDLPGRFIAPVVLSAVDHSMTVMRDETFGPVVPVMPFDTEEEAVRLAACPPPPARPPAAGPYGMRPRSSRSP